MTSTVLLALPGVAAILLAACSSPPGQPRAPGPGPAAAAPRERPCIERFTVDRDRSVLEEQRRVGPGLDDFQKGARAVPIDEATFIPVETVAKHRLDGRPLMWFPPDRGAAVVDARVFASDLEAADPTRMNAGAVTTVGRLTEAARGRIPGRELAMFLVESGLVQTYWHIEAHLCLVSEGGEAGAYEAVFDGEHVYYTNEENRERVAFAVRVAADGTITVVGR